MGNSLSLRPDMSWQVIKFGKPSHAGFGDTLPEALADLRKKLEQKFRDTSADLEDTRNAQEWLDALLRPDQKGER